MAFPGSIYAPPSTYTETNFETPLKGLSSGVRVPLLIGTGSEVLVQNGLEVVRGSSSVVDQRVVQEDETGRAVVSISATGQVTLGAFNGALDRIQVRNFPIVTGDGSGTTATNASGVNVTVNGSPVVVLAVSGATGVLRLSVTPLVTDDVQVTYYFNRTDTLITDTVSDQISVDAPLLYGAVGENYTIVTGTSDTLIVTVDDSTVVTTTISVSPVAGWTAAQVAAFVNSAATGTTLVAGTAIDNFGNTVLSLSADRDVSIGAGTANSILGFTEGVSSSRNKVFYTFQGPIVDGTNGGVTSTDPSDVTVLVDGVQVIPTSVDGLSRAVTLPFAPEIGAVVTVRYYFNTWQDTFDYLAHVGVTDIFLAGLTPDRNDYIEEADFILKDDLILWGTASLVEAGASTTGATLFDDTQITATLVDTRQYMAACTSVVNQAVNPPVESRTLFQLPLQPTTGNGRNSPLGTTTFNSVANGRLDLPTNRPDLVSVFWGWSLSDAVIRGAVEVTQVESSTSRFTLAEPVPVGASVYATFFYNTIVDQEYTVTSDSEGASGVGTYTVTNAAGTSLLTPTLGVKSAALATITLQFPSGSELTPDVRLETPFNTLLGPYVGPVEETVTVTFAAQDATLGKYTVPGSGPYYTVAGASDHFDIVVDGAALAGTGGFVDLSDPVGGGSGFAAQLTGDTIEYTGASGGATYVIDATTNTVDLEVDGVLINAIANAGATQNASDYVEAINRAAGGEFAAALAGSIPTTLNMAAISSDQDEYYTGWVVRVTAGPAAGDERTVTAYNGTTKIATVAAWSGAPLVGNAYHIYDPTTLPIVRSATRFLGATTITLSEYDELRLNYTGTVTGSTPITLIGANVIPAATYASSTALAAAIQTPMNAAIVAAGVDIKVAVAADTEGRLTFTLAVDPTDTGGGYLEFVPGAAAVDFAVLAGLDAATASNGQAKLVNSAIARRFTFAGAPLTDDRIILRNRLVPGQTGSLTGDSTLAQTQLKVLGGTGATLCGLTPNELGLAGTRGNIMEPSLVALTGLANGQVPAGTYGTASDGQPVITFFAAGGTTPQNNVLNFTFDGIPVTVEFTDAAGAALVAGSTADVPLGPVAGVAEATVLFQIAAAMTAAGIGVAPLQEGAGIRLRATGTASSSSIIIGTGSANTVLGFTAGATAMRTDVQPEVLVSCLMGSAGAAVSTSLLSLWPTGGSATYFAGELLAKTVRDAANAEYLYLQSMGNAGAGTTSSVAIAVAATDSVTRPGTGLGVSGGEGGVGETAIDGFFVTSSNGAAGSGTSGTSVLNSGTGQDGEVGQTYRDEVTGLTFSILAREGGGTYPAAATFTFQVRSAAVTDSNLPVNTIPGLQLIVSNTLGVPVDDTAIVSTFDKGGSQPAVGDVYYVSYNFAKQTFTSQLYTKMSTIESAFGANGTENPVTLASYLAITNGAVAVAIKQVQKDQDTDADGLYDVASEAAFLTALTEVEGPLTGGTLPDMLVPLKGDSLTLFQALALHCDVQSSIRYRSERTAIVGLSAGTQPRDAGDRAEAVSRTRLRMVYPDIYTLTLDQASGSSNQFLVDGTYMAAAVAGSRAAPTIDVATPWTGARIFGFDDIARVLDAVQQNQVAVRGVTVMDQQRLVIKIRQGLTTDTSNILTKLPTVITIADEVQRQARSSLDRFVGTKFLAGVTGQIEAQLSNTLKLLQGGQIISGYTGVAANVASDDPTVAEATAAYMPVFPLLYIVVSFNLRSSL